MLSLSSSSSTAVRVATCSITLTRLVAPVSTVGVRSARPSTSSVGQRRPMSSIIHSQQSLPASTSTPVHPSASLSRRTFSATSPPPSHPSPLSEDQYGRLAEQTMEGLHDSLEVLVEGEQGGLGGWEVEYSSGVLTLIMGDHGTYVINKQPPNKQIWLSSPVSGPKRFDYVKESGWVYLRDGTTLGGLMRTELKEMVGSEVDVDVGVEGTSDS